MRHFSFNTCVMNGKVVGAQFSLKSTTDSTEVMLAPLGYLPDGSCRKLDLSEGFIESIKVSFSSRDDKINAITYYKGDT